ncbi:MAG: xanthine dehydrogenase molybdopterin binding subunit [Rhodobacteraceae bacterium]|nr:xanthine dehydrogenase molybdopterin binding subunit [Paracoccaceae bacterium]
MSVAKSIPHDSGQGHVSGAARYVDDYPMPADTVHLAFGLSANAHADFTLDISVVRAAEGVIDVLVASDLPGENDVSPAARDEPLLAVDVVHYIGQPIFLVVADTHLNARRAARLGRVSYTEKTPLVTLDQAIAAGSSFGEPLTFAIGDAENALKNAPHAVSGTMEIGGQEHFYLEGQAAYALPEEGDVRVVSSTQHPSEIQHKVAEALHLPFHAVRVETRRMGGGFGGKESQGNALAVSCAVVALRLDRPAKMRYDRDDDMIITGKRHDFRIKYRAGFGPDGKIESVVFEHFVKCGWALDLSHPVADRAMLHADNAYHLPNAKIVSHRLRTNTQSNTAYRGFGGPQGILGIERVIEHIASDLGLDPLTVRQANFYAAKGELTPYHMEVEDSISAELVAQLADSAGYKTRRVEIAKFNAGSKVVKRGISLVPVKFGISFTLTFLNQAGALVHVYADGSVQLNHGGTEMGQGLNTKVAQVAAQVFGLGVETIKITATDTGKVPNTSATAASSGADLNGMACKDACEKIRTRMMRFLGERYDCGQEDIRFEAGNVTIAGEVISFAEAAAMAYQARVSLSATGFYKTPKLKWDRLEGKGRPFLYFSYGAAVSEVELDTLTGENRILRTDILHDVGNSLNPALDIGQIEGAFVQGAGWLTIEELRWADDGRLLTAAPATYKIPCASDAPDQLNVALWDGANREKTIYRSKAVGEPPFVHGMSVFMALSAALAAAGGQRHIDAPATAERLLMALQN